MSPVWTEKLERCSSLPALPAVAVDVLRLCDEEDPNLGKIAEVVRKDPALAARVLGTANSPLFGLRREVGNLPVALGLLGVNALRAMVLSFALHRCAPPAAGGLLDRYWRRSILSAFAAQALCEGAGEGHQEEALLGALLQDIGMLAFFRLAHAGYEELVRACDGDHDRLGPAERNLFGGDHPEAGAWLLERWRLPEWLVGCVAASHGGGPSAGAGTAVPDCLISAVVLSGRFADIWVQPDAAAATRRAREEADRVLGAGAVDAGRVCARLLECAPEISRLFDVPLDVEQMTAVLDQAQETLVEALVRQEAGANRAPAATQLDPVTALPGRGPLEERLEAAYQRAQADRVSQGIIFADVDEFKTVNDTYGHCAGDAVLRSVARCLAGHVRENDFAARFGGDEFVVVMATENLEQLAAAAERLRAAVACCDHSLEDGRSLRVSLSLGCAMLDAAVHRCWRDALDEADRALYAAKRAGKNRVETACEVR